MQDIIDRIKSVKLPLSEGNLVFGKGNENAEIMFIGEAPGEQEDRQGEPFVGAAGKQLDKLLNLIQLSLSDVYIANILKYRPPGNRDPNPEEIRTHTPFLIDQIKSIKPKVLVTLGNFSTKFVLNGFSAEGMENIEGITRLHGKERTVKLDEAEFLVFPSYHPAAMLYNPNIRIAIEEDFQKLKKLITSR